ncbi:hypothetical protein ACFQ0B_59020 [Nonomuraea thailandensis]
MGLFAREMSVEGEFSLRFARVSGPLTLRRSVLRNPGGLALHGGGLNAEAGLYLSLVETEGTVWLEGAAVGRALNLDGARLRAPAAWRCGATASPWTARCWPARACRPRARSA